MKKIIPLLLFFLFSYYAHADLWTQKANFGGIARHAAVGFFLNGKGYIGTGGTFASFKKDLWEWDPVTDVWTQKADFGGSGRNAAVGFAIGNFGYIATGGSNQDMWAYDPATNSWTQKANFGGGNRHYAVGFELNGYGYLGTGSGGPDKKDFWQYDPVADTWTQMADFGGSARSSATGFSVNGKGYLGIGWSGGPVSDFWEYDPGTNTWTQKADFGGGPRSDGVSFGICEKGYIATGVSSSVSKKDLWEYDPVTDTWTQKSDCGGSGRENAVGFTDGTYGYVGTGTNVFNEFGDFWQYTPDDVCPILPIGLTSFTATQQGRQINLRWTTESEINNNYFTVEKSLDALHFETLCTVKGQGNSETLLNYEAADEHPFTGLNYYRLKQTDFDGTSSYSSVVSCRAAGLEMMTVLSVTPNPVQSVIDITTDVSDDENLEVQLFTVGGHAVYNKLVYTKKDIQHTDVDLSALQEGIYLLRVQCEYGSYSQKLIKVN